MSVKMLKEFVSLALLEETPALKRAHVRPKFELPASDVPEADREKAQLGKWALPTYNTKAFGSSKEALKRIEEKDPDTEEEKRLARDLIMHFEDNIHLNAADNIVIRHALENGWYKNMFFEPTVDVYRGLRHVAIEKLAKLLRMPVESLTPGKHDVDATIRSSQNSDVGSSWSKSMKVAISFIVDDHLGGYIDKVDTEVEFLNVVLAARARDNPNLFWDTRNFDTANPWEAQAEVVALVSDIRIYAVYIMTNTDARAARSKAPEHDDLVLPHDHAELTKKEYVRRLIDDVSSMTNAELDDFVENDLEAEYLDALLANPRDDGRFVEALARSNRAKYVIAVMHSAKLSDDTILRLLDFNNAAVRSAAQKQAKSRNLRL